MGISSIIKKISKNSPKFINEISDFPETLSLIRKKLNNNDLNKEISNLKSEVKNSRFKNAILFIILITMIFYEIIQ